DVADELDPLLRGVCLDCRPLAVEEELAQLVPVDARRQRPPHALQHRGLAADQVVAPLVPAHALVVVLQRHEKRVLVEPAGLAVAELLEGAFDGRRRPTRIRWPRGERAMRDRHYPTLWRYILRDSGRRPGRTLLTVAGIVLAVTVVTAIRLSNHATRESYAGMYRLLAGRTDLEV